MKKIFISILLLLPLGAFAAVPAFPMSFYGTATVNGVSAPTGTVIRAYYGITLAGEVTLTEAGVYGYNSPTAQQLLVAEGTGTIRFTVKDPAINGGVETEGDTVHTYIGFTAGETVPKNFAFTWIAPTPAPSPSPTPSPSPAPTPAPAPAPSPAPATSGGGGSTSVLYGCMDSKAMNYSVIANRDNGACIYPVATTTRTAATNTVSVRPSTGSATPTPVVAKPKGEVLGAATFIFMRNLTIGSSGADITELQKRLTAEGLYSGPISGYFGPLTAAAVKKFQSAHGLEAVGNVGPKTRGVLNQGGAVLGAATTSVSVTIPATKPSAERAELIRQLLAMIQELQKQLAALKTQ
jgi:hypothetical protein